MSDGLEILNGMGGCDNGMGIMCMYDLHGDGVFWEDGREKGQWDEADLYEDDIIYGYWILDDGVD